MNDLKTLEHCLVLVVDDTEANVDILMEALGDDYDVAVAMDGPTALELAATQHPDIILLDIMMPGMDGFEVCRRLKSVPATAEIPVIFLTALTETDSKTKGLELGAVDYVTKPFEILEVRARIHTHLSLRQARLELSRQNEILEEKVAQRTAELALTQEVVIEAMAGLAEYRDPDTGGHIKRTKNYVRILAKALQDHPKFRGRLDDDAIDLLYKSAPLHDIGKVGVRDEILLKPGRLTDEEFVLMRQHTVFGHDAIKAASARLGENSFLDLAREIAYTHQERWDGSGYPQGLIGEAIPVSGRLMAIVDVYDALISRRVYKAPIPHPEAVETILAGRGTQFDPDVVDVFLTLAEDFRHIAIQYADRDEEREALANPYEPHST